MQIRLFYCPFAFRIDAKIQYVVANFVQNVMCALRQKNATAQWNWRFEVLCRWRFLHFLPFSYLVRQTVILSARFCRQIAYIYGIFRTFAKAYRKLHCLQTVATLHIFRQRYCCLGKTNKNLISKLHKTYFGKLQKHSQFLTILRFLHKKRQA